MPTDHFSSRFEPWNTQIFASPSTDAASWANVLNNGFKTTTNPDTKAQLFKLAFDRPVTFQSYFIVSYT
jgi:hypothetical protein